MAYRGIWSRSRYTLKTFGLPPLSFNPFTIETIAWTFVRFSAPRNVRSGNPLRKFILAAQSIADAAQKSGLTSVNLCIWLPAGNWKTLATTAAYWARVIEASGANVPSPKPTINPWLTNVSTKGVAQCPAISEKLEDIRLGVSSTAINSTKPFTWVLIK